MALKTVKTLFYQFGMGDVEDPEIYVAQPIYEWQQTEKGKWCMENSIDPQYTIGADNNSWGYRVTLYGGLEDKDAVFFELKWSSK